MAKDKYHPYQTLGDVIWLALTDKKDTPPVDQKKKEQEQKKKKR